METTCKKCSSTNVVHNGKVRNRQRYRCNSCGLNFVIGDRRDKTKIEAKALALLMYGSCKASYGMIARLLKVSRTTVLNWIREMGRKLPEPEIPSDIHSVQIDEMWHFINKKKTKNMDLASRGL